MRQIPPEPTRFFEVDRNYSQLLSGAHRKPAIPIGSPALVCHLALWQPDDRDGQTEDIHHQIKSESDWTNRIDEYIRALVFTVKEKSAKWYSPSTDNQEFEKSEYLFLFGSAMDLRSAHLQLVNPLDLSKKTSKRLIGYANQTVVIIFEWQGMRVVIRVEKHIEYIQITSIMDMSEPSYPSFPSHSSESKLYDMVEKSLHLLDDKLHTRYEAISKARDGTRVPASDEDKALYGELHTELFSTVWDRFFNEILISDTFLVPDGNNGLRCAADFCDARRGRHIGSVFADFRGVVLNRPGPAVTREPKGAFFNYPGWFETKPRWARNKGDEFDEEEANVITRAVWPFLTNEPRLHLNRLEFTVSRMLANRAIYITALGAQPSPYSGAAVHREAEQLPVFYFSYASTNSRWQLGRLIDKINHCGTTRIAAIQEYERLLEKSDVLRSLSGPIDKYVALLAANKNVDERTIEAELANAVGQIVTWNSSFRGGLTYRIERSRYYVNQFRETMGTLSIRRVAGYQPYDVFVENRLGAIFDFINRLGIRLSTFERRLALIYQAVGAKQSIRLSIASRKLAITAEALFVGIAAPYYMTGLIEHLSTAIENVPATAAEPRGHTVAFLTAAIEMLLVLGCYGYLTYRIKQERDHAKPSIGSVTASAGAACDDAISD